MAKTYADKATIPAVGVSKVRKFGGPVDLAIVDKETGVTDNFPMGLTDFDLFGAVIKIEEDLVTKYFIANEVYDLDGKVYFKLGATPFYYTKSTGRVTFVE